MKLVHEYLEQAFGEFVHRIVDVHFPNDPRYMGNWEPYRDMAVLKHPFLGSVIAVTEYWNGHELFNDPNRFYVLYTMENVVYNEVYNGKEVKNEQI